MAKRTTFKAVGMSVLALTLAYCGNGADLSPKLPVRSTFKPMVARDADFAVGVNLDKEQAFKVVDAYANLLFETLKFIGKIDDKEIAEAKGKIASFKADPLGAFPKGVRQFLIKSGLCDAEFRWAVFSLAGFKMVQDKPLLGGISLAVAGTIDLDKLISAFRQEDDCDVTFEMARIEGETAWHIVPKKQGNVRRMRELQVDPYVTSLDGRLVLAATSREALVQQIRLYRSGWGKSDALGSFSAADGEWLHMHVSDVGDLFRKYVPHSKMKELNKLILDGDKLLMGLGNLDVDEKVLPNGMLLSTLSLRTASEKDADALRTSANMGLMMLKALMANQSEVPDFAKRIVNAVRIGGTDCRFEMKSLIPVGTCAMMLPALYPVVKSAMLNANGNSMSMQGRKLVMGIVQANLDREGKLDPVWPRTELAGGADNMDDVAGRAYDTSTEYFNALFDMKHYGTIQWAPAVDGELISTLWGFGVPGMTGKTLESRNVAWTIAANVTDETPDFIPVLITANFNPSLLLRKWDGKTNGSERLPIGPASGAAAAPFGDKAVVVVRKSGAAEVIKAKDLTYGALYQKQAFDLTNMKPPLTYLAPTGTKKPATEMK